MTRFCAALRLQLLRLLHRPALLACLLAMPALALLLGLLLPHTTTAAPLRVGVLLPQGSANAAQLWQSLATQADESLQFEQAETRDELEAMVAATAWECGYILPDDFDARVAAGRYSRLLTRVDSPATSTTSLVDWAMTAALLELCAPDLTLAYLDRAGIVPTAEQDVLQPALSQAFGAVRQARVQLVPLQGQGTTIAPPPLGFTLARGVLALLLMLYACLGAVQLLADLGTGFFGRAMPYTGPAPMLLAGALTLLLPAAILAAASLCIMAALFPGQLLVLWLEGCLLLLYLLQLAGLAVLLAGFFRGGDTLLGLLPFLLVACLLLCPIITDLSLYLPALRPVSLLLPPTLYLRGTTGQVAALWQMPLYALATLAAGFLAGMLRRRRPTSV